MGYRRSRPNSRSGLADDVEVQTLALDGLARAAAAEGDGRSAAELLLAADDLSVRVRRVLDPDDRLDAAFARDLIR